MSIGWRNSRNELESVQASAAAAEHALSLQRAAAAEARAQRDHAYHRLSMIEEELAQHEALLSEAEAEAAELRREADEKQRQLEDTSDRLRLEQEARSQCSRECRELRARVEAADAHTSSLAATVELLRAQLAALERALATTREQLDWWPRPLTRMLGVAQCWLRRPLSLPVAVVWALVPARHGC